MKKITFAIFSMSVFLSYSATAQVHVVVTAPIPRPVIVVAPSPQPVIVVESRPAPVVVKKKKRGNAYGHYKKRKD
jgi:hypothetical protein